MDIEESVTKSEWRSKVFKIIYHADTPAGKWFDILLIIFIVLSVLTIILDINCYIPKNLEPRRKTKYSNEYILNIV